LRPRVSLKASSHWRLGSLEAQLPEARISLKASSHWRLGSLEAQLP